MEQKLFKDMTADEQLQWATDFSKFIEEKLPVLEQLGDAWEACHVKSMREGLMLMNAFQFCREYVGKALHYGDYSARVYRLRFYVDLIRKKINSGEGINGANGEVYAIIANQQPVQTVRRGRPASAATIAKREAEAKAAKQQTAIFTDTADQNNQNNPITQNTPSIPNTPTTAFIPPTTRDDLEYKLSIAQKRAFLSPDLQKASDQIRALRTTAGAAAEKAKTMAELKASPELIAPVAEEAQRTLEVVEQIYAAIDQELAELWYRLQNGSPEWKTEWLKKYGFKSVDDLHADLKSDLRHHYKKVTDKQPDFEAVMRQRIEQESPEYVEKQKAEADKKKEVQDIIRYFKRKDKGQKLDTARQKFKRLEELLGKKEAANYKPFLTKIEEDSKAAEQTQKPKKKPAKKAAK